MLILKSIPTLALGDMHYHFDIVSLPRVFVCCQTGWITWAAGQVLEVKTCPGKPRNNMLILLEADPKDFVRSLPQKATSSEGRIFKVIGLLRIVAFGKSMVFSTSSYRHLHNLRQWCKICEYCWCLERLMLIVCSCGTSRIPIKLQTQLFVNHKSNHTLKYKLWQTKRRNLWSIPWICIIILLIISIACHISDATSHSAMGLKERTPPSFINATLIQAPEYSWTSLQKMIVEQPIV